MSRVREIRRSFHNDDELHSGRPDQFPTVLPTGRGWCVMPMHYLQKGMDWLFGETDHDAINRERSFRAGSTVYYDSANRGPYADGQDALADVPPGGTFVVSANSEYDVATEGRLILDAPKTIRGEGWHSVPPRTDAGSRIVNSGADRIDAPMIRYEAASRDDRGAAIRNLAMLHEGRTTPAIHITNSSRSLVADCRINMDLIGERGILYDGASFFARVYRSFVTRFTRHGIHVTGTGGGDSIIDCHVGSGATGAIATRMEREGFRISGGQHSANGTAISVWNPTGANIRGGQIDGSIWFEHSGTGIEIDGATHRFDDITIISPRASLNPTGMGVNDLIHAGRCADLRVVFPAIFQSLNGGNLATLSSNAIRPMFMCGYHAGIAPIVNNGAAQPIKVMPTALTDPLLANVTTSIPTWVALRMAATAGSWSPVFNDGTSWYTQASANAAFTPV